MKRKSLVTKLLVCTFLLALLVLSVCIGAFAATTEEGRSFQGDDAVANLDQRLELTKPLSSVPLTYEAVIKVNGTTADADCKGTLFGNYGNKSGSYTTLSNFEIFRNSKAPEASPALCYVNNADGTSFGAVAFERDSTIYVEDGVAAKTLKDFKGEWVHVAIVVTHISGTTYDFDCYINGEKAYDTERRDDVYFTDTNVTKLQGFTPYALGSNGATANPVEFPGSIKSLALHGTSLTAEQIAASAKSGVISEGTELIAHYDMSVVEERWYEADLSGNGYNLQRADKVYNVNSEGRTFTSDRLLLTELITESPLTIEAVIKTTATGTTIFGNTTISSVGCLNFEIYGGKPALCFPVDASGTRGSVIFSKLLEGATGFSPNTNDKQDFTYLAITATSTGVANTYNFDCYVNGVKAYETITNKVAYLDAKLIQTAGYLAIGANGGSSTFNGNIRSVNLYNRPLSAAEIRASYLFESTFNGMIAGYDMGDYSHIRNPQFELDISGNGYHAQRTALAGKSFDSSAVSNPYFIHNLLKEMPRTYEATLYAVGDENGPYNMTVLGNYPAANKSCINLEFFGQKVALCLWDYDNGGKETVTFANYTPPANEWIHLVVVDEVAENNLYKLYANGELVDTKTATKALRNNLYSQETVRKISIGGSGKTHFNGGIVDIALYTEPLSAEQIMDSFKNGVNKYNDSLLAYYDLKTVAGADFIQDLSGNNHHASRNDYTKLEGGRWFNYDEERLAVEKNYEQAPLTINVEAYIPSSLKQAATMFGNFYARDYINFEIYTNGNPALVLNEIPENKLNTGSDGYTHTIIWDVDVRGEKWTDLTVVYDKTKSGQDKYALYVDGVKAPIKSVAGADINYVFEFDMEWVQRAIPFTLGRNASRCFQGKIKNLALYSAPLSESEITAMYQNGADLSREDIIAYYNLDNPQNTKTFVKDETGNGYNFVYKFFDNEMQDEDFEYSFAFLGDSQFLIYKDIYEGTTQYTKPIYDWLIKNKDEKNIQYVFGLGDVSDKNMFAEYEYASYLYKTLGENGIRYAVIPGNHDGQTTYINYNSVFSKDSYLADGMNAYASGSVANYYKNFEVGGYKYMVMVLEFGAPDKVLEWANGVVAANPDRQVIVLTHGYIGYDGGFLSEQELHSPGRNSALNSGEEIWEKFVSLHENIIISACGHIDPYNIKQRHDVGVNGNTVHQFLIDNQGLDKTWSYDTGMIAMFYFSNGGKDVRVEYVSATQSLRAQEKNPDAKDIVFGKENQFSFTLDVPKAEPIVTEYGVIPLKYSALDANKVMLFDSDKKCLGGFPSVNEAFTYLIGNCDLAGSYNILLRDNARKSDTNVNFNSFKGTLTIDLNGYEIKVDEGGNYLIDIYVDDDRAPKATFNIKNGMLTKVHGRGIACLNYGTANFTADSKTTFVFDNVTFRANSSVNNGNVVFATWENGYSVSSAKMVVASTFNNCTFDMKNSIDNAIMLPLTYNNKDRVVHNVTVNGGTVICDTLSDFADNFVTLDGNSNGRADSISFAKNMRVTLPNTEDAPTSDAEGLKFVKESENGTTTTYILVPSASIGLDFTPKASVTLDSTLIFNIYLPAHAGLGAVTLNGEIVALGEAVDGYYVISTPLMASESAEELKLVVNLTVDGTSLKGSFTFSTVKYAEKLLATAGISTAEQTLAKDMLAYINSAYVFFNGESVAKIDTILNGYTSATTINKANAKKTVPGLSGATFTLEAKPTVQFFFADGFKYADFTFKVGGRTLTMADVEEKTDEYVKFALFAYEMTETFSYTVGGDSGEYNLIAYYAYASGTGNNDYKGTDKAELTDLAAKFYNYCLSAKAYRASVIGK